uniref:Ribosomal protein S4 n=1 Tax=Babesia rodhaini TaxID=5870 RepID=A0A455R057_BABRO|nr:ribosomal protein S4 [Babesia rodhaini]
MFIKKINKLKKLNLIFLPGLTLKINKKFKKNKKNLINKNNNILTNILNKEKIIRALHNIKKKNQIKLYKCINTNKNHIGNLIIKLKLRLDYILFISNIYTTINQARQNIKHNYIYINNSIINCSNYLLINKSIIKIKKLINIYKLNNIYYFKLLFKKINIYNKYIIFYIINSLISYNKKILNNHKNITRCFKNNKIIIN